MAAITRYPLWARGLHLHRAALPLNETKERLRREACTGPRFFGEGVPSRFGMMSNLYETEEGYILQVALPGGKLAELRMTAARGAGGWTRSCPRRPCSSA